MTELKDIPYSNREIREKWHDIADDLQKIIMQTTKTNGSVADINKWRERMNGGAIVAGVFMTIIVIPILAWALYVLVSINQTINETVHNSVDQAMTAYKLTPLK